MNSKLIIGTRGSKLALIQANFVIDSLKKLHPNLNIEIKIIKTTGDKILDKQLSKVGGKGLFIKEIEDALLNKQVDLAVHSAKDLPHTLLEDFEIGAVLKREDYRDVLISKRALPLEELVPGSIIGTGSLRRIIQLKELNNSLKFEPIRGNIDTRINKLVKNDLEAIVLAAAGLKRMGWSEENEPAFFNQIIKDPNILELKVFYLNEYKCIPSVGQGALLIEIRKNDPEIFNIVNILNHEISAKCIMAERSFLREAGGGCEVPIGALCLMKGNKLYIEGFIGDEKTGKTYRASLSGEPNDFEKLGVSLAQKILSLQDS